MTTGQFHIAQIDSITVNREGRQRRELTDIDVLADSIRRLGLIHPLVVTRSFELVAGERRLSACHLLGWTAVPVQFTDELEPYMLRAIELEENVKRKDIPWQDQVMAVREYHSLRARVEPEWTQNETANAIGLSPQHVSMLLQVGEELVGGNKMVADAPQFSVARGIVRRAIERRETQILSDISGVFAEPKVQEAQSILNIDFNSWVWNAPRDIKFNMIHCDFPYGIESSAFPQGGAAAHGGYQDTKDTWDALMDSLLTATHRLTTPSCHLMFWFAMRKGDQRLYEPTIHRLEAMGWNINPLPLIWMKSDGVGIIPDPERGPRQIYETCFLGSRGDRKIVRAVANAYHAPTVRDKHMSEKPEPMLRHFFNMLVDENTILLDPTCGSGSALRAAESLGARFVLGLEINTEFATRAEEALKRTRRLRKAEEIVGG